MDPSIIVAIISGVVAIIGPIITFFVTREKTLTIGLTNIKGRQLAIAGIWRGEFVQEIDGTVVKTPLEIIFTAGKKIAKGVAQFSSPFTNSLTKLDFIGGFYYERYLRFEYRNSNEHVIQLGCAILELSADGKRLKGRYTGYGAETDRIVSGTADLIKSN